MCRHEMIDTTSSPLSNMQDTSIQTVSTEETQSVVQSIEAQNVIDLVSWISLWIGFAVASIFTACQLRVRSGGGSSPPDVEQGGTDAGTSRGDVTRQTFYKLLLVALVSRFLLLPVEAWAAPTWYQFAADTFPYMTFASAWALLVSFFVQLVETASGMASESSGKTLFVMQAIAYTMYAAFMITYVWNDSAILLLEALLCCIYAALFATLVYFGPKLLSLLRPSLVRRSGLAIRLVACSIVCLLVFGARTVGLAQRVLLLGQKESPWWYKYGALELFPAVALLIMMKKKRASASGGISRSPSAAPGTTPPSNTTAQMRRSGSDKALPPKRGEAASLLTKSVGAYGTVDVPHNHLTS